MADSAISESTSSAPTSKPDIPQTGEVKKGSLSYEEGNETITFLYNPEKVELSRTGKLKLNSQVVVNQAEVVEEGHIKITLSGLRFEGRNVEQTVNILMDWMEPAGNKTNAEGQETAVAKDLKLRMGQETEAFERKAVLGSVSANYTRFSRAGVPIRATVTLTLDTVHEKPKRQNPTSGSDLSGRAHTVIDGDNLQRIANTAYGKPAAWRQIAEANRIDDPLRVRAGRQLFVPGAR